MPSILPLMLTFALVTAPALARGADTWAGLVRAASLQRQAEIMSALKEGTEVGALLKEAETNATDPGDARFFAQWPKQNHVSPREIVKLALVEREAEGWALRFASRTPLLHLRFGAEGPGSLSVNGRAVKARPGHADETALVLAKLLAGEKLGGWPELLPAAYALEPITMVVAAAFAGVVGFGVAEYMLPTALSKFYAGALNRCESDRGHHRPYEGSAAASLVRALKEQGITAASFPEKKPGRCGSDTLARAMAASPGAKRSGDTEAGCTQIAWFLDCAGKFEAGATKSTAKTAPADTSMGDN